VVPFAVFLGVTVFAGWLAVGVLRSAVGTTLRQAQGTLRQAQGTLRQAQGPFLTD
jgi:uncharacterized membrane protein